MNESNFNPKDHLHSELNNMYEVAEWTSKNCSRIYGVYCRTNPCYQGKMKIGKSYFMNGILVRTDRDSNSPAILETHCFLPCKNEKSALEMEKAMLNQMDSYRVNKSRKKGKKSGGIEWIDIQDTPENTFKRCLNELGTEYINWTNRKKRNYENERRDYQLECSNAYEAHRSNDASYFFISIVPRNGKNVAYIGSVVNSAIKKGLCGTGKPIFVGLGTGFPMVFSGWKRDIEDWNFFDKKIKFINTVNNIKWEDELENCGEYDFIFIAFSFQGQTNASVKKELTEKLGIISWYDIGIDEGDSYARTEKSISNLEDITKSHITYISGSFEYEIRHLFCTTPVPNFYSHSIQDRNNDILCRKQKKSLIQHIVSSIDTECSDYKNAVELIKEGSFSSHLSVLMQTKNEMCDIYKKDDSGFYVDSSGSRIEFFYQQAVINHLKKLITLEDKDYGLMEEYWKELYNPSKSQVKITRIEDRKFILVTCPSIASEHAMFNLLKVLKFNNHIERDVVLIRENGEAAERENNIIDIMKEQEEKLKGLFIVTTQMGLRGLTLKTGRSGVSTVIRFDNFSDNKINLQIICRAVNDDNENIAFIFDANQYRPIKSGIELVDVNKKPEESLFEILESFFKTGAISIYNKSVKKIVSFDEGREIYLSTIEFDGLNRDYYLSDTIDWSKIDICLSKVENTKNQQDEEPGSPKIKKKKNDKEKNNVKKDKNEQKKQTIKNILAKIPLLITFIYDGKYLSIKDIFEDLKDTDTKLLYEFFNYKCNVEITESELYSFLETFNSVIDHDKVNEQIQKLKSLDNSELYKKIKFDVKKDGDVSTNPELAKKIVSGFPKWSNNKTVFESCCKNGENLVAYLNHQKTFGINPKDIVPFIYVSDLKEINIIITKRRLKNEFDIDLIAENCKVIKGEKNEILSVWSKMNFDFSLSNPPYNNGGVKRGGGFFIHFLSKISDISCFSKTVCPITFMMRLDCNKLRKKLIKNGIVSIEVLPFETFKSVNAHVCIVTCDKNNSSEEFTFSNGDSFNRMNKSDHKLGEVIPFSTSHEDTAWFKQVISNDLSVKIYSGIKKNYHWAVSWEYLIGLQKDRFNGKIVVRNIRVVEPGEKLNKNQRFVKFENEDAAKQICLRLQETAHRFIKMLPRGSSVENWMMAPLIQHLMLENKILF